METCLGDLSLHWCIIYLDDIVIFSKDPARHLERLEAVFQKLEEARLKLKPSKCELFWWQIAYLGHIVCGQGIATNECKIEAIKKWPVLTNIMEVRSFLGFMGYYLWLIPKFAQVAWPPTWVDLRWECWQEKGCYQVEWQVPTGLWWPEKDCEPQPLFLSTWTSSSLLSSTPMLVGLAWELSSTQTHEDGMDSVIAYASRSLTKAKSHYPTHKLEFLALKWALVEKFYRFLFGSTFDIYMDNNPITYVLTTAKLDAVSHWWVASLANNNFWLYYQAGKN